MKRAFMQQPGSVARVFRFRGCGAAVLAGTLFITPALGFDRPLLFPPFGPPMIAAHPAYRFHEAPLHPRDIVDILIEEHGFQAVRRPRFAGPIYVTEGIDRRGNLVEIVLDSGNGRVIEREIIERGPRDPRLAHAKPFANRTLPDQRQPDSVPAPPRRPPALTGQKPAPVPPDSPRRAETAPASTPAPMTPVPSRPRFADPRPLGEPDQPPPFARGVRPAEP